MLMCNSMHETCQYFGNVQVSWLVLVILKVSDGQNDKKSQVQAENTWNIIE